MSRDVMFGGIMGLWRILLLSYFYMLYRCVYMFVCRIKYLLVSKDYNLKAPFK